jgi:hypothetical protein
MGRRSRGNSLPTVMAPLIQATVSDQVFMGHPDKPGGDVERRGGLLGGGRPARFAFMGAGKSW